MCENQCGIDRACGTWFGSMNMQNCYIPRTAEICRFSRSSVYPKKLKNMLRGRAILCYAARWHGVTPLWKGYL